MTQPNGTESYMTTREMVAEIRKDVKALAEAMPSKETVDDHETRIRGLERFRYAIPGSAGLSAVAAVVATVAALFHH